MGFHSYNKDVKLQRRGIYIYRVARMRLKEVAGRKRDRERRIDVEGSRSQSIQQTRRFRTTMT